MRWAELAGRRVAVWGYGREGRAVLAALARHRPELVPILLCTPDEAATAVAAHGARIACRPGEPDAATLAAFDVIVKSPGVSAYKPALLAATGSGVQVTSGTALWFAAHPGARVIGVTGTKGKSTTTALIAHLLRGLGRRVALAGNIGLPLLDLPESGPAPDWHVLEFSSFQTREAGRCAVGVVNNLHEEHLDWHGTRERYAADKLALAAVSERLVVNGRQPELLARTADHAARRTFGTDDGWHVADAAIRCGAERIHPLAGLPLPGLHNALNACAALAAIEAAGEDARAASTHLATFRPLPHRLQTLGERDGRTWINDSIATTPAATLEALHSLHSLHGRAVVVLIGGHERGLDWQPFTAAVRREPPHAIVAMGANGPRIAAVLEAGGALPCALVREGTLDAAVAAARSLAPIGGVVLLSPGAPSFDQFRDYAERGRRFAALAGFDPGAIASIEGLGVA